ncbi:MAG TPA: hypothetical protein VHO70_08490 [Chitinispirillaceae bacterium]|nr:hypothetical protein [Chitinispirillaceae bacterium]
MSGNKYGLDFKVWGDIKITPKQEAGNTPSPPPKPTAAKTSEPVSLEDEPILEEPVKKDIRLTNPRFLPDSATVMGKECAVSVDIISPEKKGSVIFELRATYKEKEYGFSQFKKVPFNGNNVSTILFLEYVNEYVTESEKVPCDPTLHVDYFFKVTAQGAGEVRSDIVTLPYLDKASETIQKCSAAGATDCADKGGSIVCTCIECTKCPPEVCKEFVIASEKTKQSASAYAVSEAAKVGEPCTHNCTTCENKDACGTA